MSDELTERQERFVEAYLVHPNATKAALEAGYSERSAGAIGHEIMKKPEVLTAIDEARTARAERVRLSADWVVQKLAETYERATEAGDHRAAVTALVALGKHFGIFERHQRQRYVTDDEAARLEAELRVLVGGFDRVHAPPVLVNDPR